MVQSFRTFCPKALSYLFHEIIINKDFCNGGLFLEAVNPDAIVRFEREGKRTLFNLNFEIPLDVKDWRVVPNSGQNYHSKFCYDQMTLAQQVYEQACRNGDFIRRRVKPYTFPRFSKNGALTRGFRRGHTQLSKYASTIQVAIITQWHIETNHGDRFPPMVMNMRNEKRSSYYHGNKLMNDLGGPVEARLLVINDTDRKTLR